MGMTYTFKDANGNMIFSVEGVNSVTGNDISLESMAYDIKRKGNEICNSLERINFVSDTRAMEALGYEKGAGFKANVKAVSNAIWEKIKKFFGKIKEFFQTILSKISGKLDNAAAKRAAAKVVKKLENPTDADKDIELAKIHSILDSSDMGEFALIRKYSNVINKITDADRPGKFSEKDSANLKKQIGDIKAKASKVSSGEKRKAAIDFYNQISTSGIERYKSELNDKIKQLDGSMRAVQGSMNNMTDEEALKSANRWYELLTDAYGLVISEQRVSAKFLIVLSAIDTARD